jgi:hypothetical protein
MISFGMTDIPTRTCIVLGVRSRDDMGGIFMDSPAPLLKGVTVRLVAGKFPLTDYTDNGREQLTVELASGQQVTGTLNGFTHDCTAPFLGKLGTPQFHLTISLPSGSNNPPADSPNCTADSAQ